MYMNSLMNQIKKIGKTIAAPLEKHFYFFITILVLHALVDVVFFYIYWRFSLQVVLNGFLMAYLLTIPCLYINKYNLLFKVYKWLVFLPYIISFTVDVVSHAVLDSSLDGDVAATILATNKDEIVECVETFFSITPILIGIVILFATFKVYQKLKQVRPRFIGCWMVGVILGAVMTYMTPWSGLGGVIGKIAVFYESKTPIDISAYARVPEVRANPNAQPENVVMIIGESLTKLHCSSYGYGKPTTPKLETLIRDSLLIQFNEVISPEVHTLPVFKTLFSQYRVEWGDSVKWYTCPTLQNILHQSGYRTYWISNQSKRGVSDNFIGKYAELCTENYFVGNKLAGMKRKTYDGEVLALLKPLLREESSDSLKRNFYVVHLMGSHFKFAKRYPKEFDHFQGNEYPELSLRQREVVATYDNSVLYNDSVVYEVMNQFADKESIVFYFSDHAIDLYQSSSSYYGHAKKTKESFGWGQLIPFYVYVSPKYQKRFPEIITKLRKRVNKQFCTDNMFYTIMNVIDTEFVSQKDVKKYSLLAD